MPEDIILPARGKSQLTYGLTLQIYEFFQNLVADRDNLTVRLETSLCGNQIYEFFGHVNVGGFDVAGDQAGLAYIARCCRDTDTGVIASGCGVVTASCFCKTFLILELSDCYLANDSFFSNLAVFTSTRKPSIP